MPYISGGIVTDSDYNDLAYETGAKPTVLPTTAKVGDIFGTGFEKFGYGGNSTNVGVTDLPAIAALDVIQSATDVLDSGGPPGDPDEWVNLHNAFIDCATHQGTPLTDPLPGVGFLEDGDIVSAGATNDFDNLNSTPNNLLLQTNKDVADAGSVAVATIGTSTRGTSWTSFVRHEFTVDFGDEDSARHFFNTGGQIIINASRSGGSATAQNTAWTNLLVANSPYTFTQTEYFALTTGFVTQASFMNGSPYQLNMWDIRAKADAIPNVRGGAGSLLRFRSDFTDGHSNVFFDEVDGTLTSTIEEKRSVTVFLRPTPTFATTEALTVGS